ncbi:hypothetical protein FRB99_000246 [Tulasnella sp. 403]|nr:hypothetical protein FRB99_000246 [Tulasnella sp. 403]
MVLSPPPRSLIWLTGPFDPDVTIQMFQWSYDSIAAESVPLVGSPIEHVNGTGWYTPYQPVSYKFYSKFGDRGAFASMVQRCNNVGVKVLVDVVWNHMSGGGSDKVGGLAGSLYTHWDYPGIYNFSSFHHCTSPDGQIDDYNNHYQVVTCELEGLADLDTGQDYVQNVLAAYGNDLISMGASGFRLDASKSIEPSEVTQILAKLTHPVYITQEGPGSPNYLDLCKNGDYQEFRIVEDLGNAFQGFDLTPLMKIPSDQYYTPSDKAVIFVTNHDRERKSPRLTYKSPNNQYSLAQVWVLGYNYGTPEVLSSYTFTNTDIQGPNGLYGTCKGDGGDNGWLCQHRWPMIVGMVQFRKVVGDADVNSVTNGNALWLFSRSAIAWGRGDKGFVAINNAILPWRQTLKTQLPDGTYCDVLHGRQNSSDACPGVSIKVSGGSFDITVAAYDAVAFHVGAMLQTPTTVTFTVTASTEGTNAVFVAGSIPELGNWDPTQALALTRGDGNNWSGKVTLKQAPDFQYKYIEKAGDAVSWEQGPNRVMTPDENRAWPEQFGG